MFGIRALSERELERMGLYMLERFEDGSYMMRPISTILDEDSRLVILTTSEENSTDGGEETKAEPPKRRGRRKATDEA